jgi:hypothetical protein
MNAKDSYRNPFSEYNAIVIGNKKILEYWCSPFRFIQFAEISEHEVLSEGMPIIFMGGRGTGKTMFLKYFSYYVQSEKALKTYNRDISKHLIQHFKNIGGIGAYIRLDLAALNSFSEFGLSNEKWHIIFTHYFELVVCKEFIEILNDILKKDALELNKLRQKFIPEVARLLGEEEGTSDSLEDLIDIIRKDMTYVNRFRANLALSDVNFKPKKLFVSKELSFGIVKLIRETIDAIPTDLSFIIFIDEYENFLVPQQKVINTLLKFVEPGITFRIGMRLEGFNTYETVTEKEFLKEGRDYRKIVFDDVLIKDKNYQKFLLNIAMKRLESVPIFKSKGFIDISKFLGKSENLKKEAYDLVNKRRNPLRHFDLLKHRFKKIKKKEIEPIRYQDNPLIEMLNILWVLRENDINFVGKIMEGYLKMGKFEDQKIIQTIDKYRMDYVDKYKLSLMFLLSSIYKEPKLYYSFNTFCFLSSGIVGNFIELCRKSFEYAHFEDRKSLLEKGKIPMKIQDKAARDVSKTELNMITRIPKYGDYIYRFIDNLGNIFREYHTDRYITYPETNQFSLNMSSITDKKIRESFRFSLMWSVIQRKPKLQRTKSVTHKKGIYTINRIFAPLFEISYRTRGGYSGEDYNINDVKNMMTKENVRPKRRFNKNTSIREHEKVQRSFDFDWS